MQRSLRQFQCSERPSTGSPAPARPAALATFLNYGFATLMILVTGCNPPGPQAVSISTHTDRLMQIYPELRGGRFAVIADFEALSHMELVQIFNVSGRGGGFLDNNAGRRETGGTGLRFAIGHDDDAIIFNNDRAVNWSMKRDWRPYDLLLISVRVNRPGLRARLSIAAGQPGRRSAIETDVPLKQGWNQLKFDLAEVGERVALDDIREIELSILGAPPGTNAYIDDVLLTGFRREVLGDPDNLSGGLYAQEIGKRWRIGAGGRFEITFAKGQIVAWHNLAADPFRVRNLVEGVALGPAPVVLAADDHGVIEGDFRDFGERVAVEQEILEMSPVRVVLASQWQFVDQTGIAQPGAPFQRWVYTIYPTGQIYVDVQCTASSPRFTPPRLGLAVSLSAELFPSAFVHQPGGSPSDGPLADTLYATARGQDPEDPFLLYALSSQESATRMAKSGDAGSGVFNLIASGPSPDGGVQHWRCHLHLGSSQENPEADSGSRALGYASPSRLRFEMGGPADADGRSTTGSGFDQATGCYLVKPEKGVRFTVDPAGSGRFTPAFVILDTEDVEGWVYINGKLFERTGRDLEGRLIFQLPTQPTEKTTVEVLLSRPDRP